MKENSVLVFIFYFSLYFNIFFKLPLTLDILPSTLDPRQLDTLMADTLNKQ